MKTLTTFPVIPTEEMESLNNEFGTSQLTRKFEFETESMLVIFFVMGELKSPVSGTPQFPLLSKAIWVLSHSSAGCERIFSICVKICTHQRSEIKTKTLRGVLANRMNLFCKQYCYQLYLSNERLKKARVLCSQYFNKIISKLKYMFLWYYLAK